LKKESPAVKKVKNSNASSPYRRIEDKLATHFSTRVRIKQSKRGDGQLIIEFYTTDELNKILRQLNAPLD
jgi:ParB family chromosome partitioning protein